MSHMHWSLYKALLQVPSKGWLDDHCLTPDFNGSTNCSLLNIHFNTEHDDSSLELGWIGCILLIIGVYKPTTKSSPPTSNKPFGTLPWKLHSPSAGSSPCIVFIALAMTGSHPKVTRQIIKHHLRDIRGTWATNTTWNSLQYWLDAVSTILPWTMPSLRLASPFLIFRNAGWTTSENRQAVGPSTTK